jgi:predicted dehydrogenase
MSSKAQKIPFAMIGGGLGSAIGLTHRNAAQMDNLFELKAGVFSSDHRRGTEFGARVGVAPGRCYPSVDELVLREAKLSDGIKLASIVTPNAMHAPAARVLLENDIHVMCEKPMTLSHTEAVEIEALARKHGLVFALAHGYCGYGMVREARSLVAEDAIGTVVMVQSQYASGWASRPIGKDAKNGAIWRTDPAQVGPSSALGDLGTHAHHMVRFVTGLEITEVAADLTNIVPGRDVDDTAQLLIRFENGACGMMWVTMAAAGNGNELGFKVYGQRGHIEWNQETPDILSVRHIDGTVAVRRRAIVAGSLSAELARRRPGQPEGLVDAFANLYRDVAAHMRKAAETDAGDLPRLPDATDGVWGMGFVEAAVHSNTQGGAWTTVEGVRCE